MLARHAEGLFWAGRYLERAEDTARMLDVTYHSALQVAGDDGHDNWGAVLDVLQARGAFYATGRGINEASVTEYLVLDRTNPGSIVSSVAAARENFRTVREHLSTEVWEAVNRFHLDLQARDLRADLNNEPYTLYDLVKVRSQTLAGVAAQSMARDESYAFLRVGWLIERALITARLLEVNYATLDHDHYDAFLLTLRSASALEAYRRSFQSSTSPTHVADFLLQSSEFPRSVLFCLQRAEAALGTIANLGGTRNRARRQIGRVRSELEFVDVAELVANGLKPALGELTGAISEIANMVAAQYFRVGDEDSLHAQYVLPGEAMAS